MYETLYWLARLVLLILCCVLIFHILSSRELEPFHLPFFVLPLSQLFLLYYCLSDTPNVLWLLLGILMGLGAEFALLAYTRSYEKQVTLEQELADAQHAIALEQRHRADVKKCREQLVQLRSDCHTRLDEIAQALSCGENGDAQLLLDALAEDIRQTRENIYCAIPVVNAVLTEKQKECWAVGIRMDIRLSLPPYIPVDPLHLCSIFSNLLDNAIHGAQSSGQPSPTVQLTAAIEGGYLFIKTINPFSPQSKPPGPGHGYGLAILKSLAQQYGGEYISLPENGTYTAIITLSCETQAEK